MFMELLNGCINILQENISESAINIFSVIASILLVYYLLNSSGILGSIVHTARVLRGIVKK